MTGRTLEEIEALAADATPGPWVLNSDPPYDSVVGSNGRTVCCDTAYYPTAVDIEDMRLIAAIHNLLAIAQGQRGEIERLKARYAWIDSGFGDLDFHREEAKHKGPKRGCKASYYWMRIGVKMVTGGRRLVKSDDAKDAEPVADGIHSPYFDDDWRG